MTAHPKPMSKKTRAKPQGAATKPLKKVARAKPRREPTLAMERPEKPTETKAAMILKMLEGSGATSAQLEEATGWKPHSVRGMLGIFRRRGIRIISTKEPGKPVVYSLAPEEPVL